MSLWGNLVNFLPSHAVEGKHLKEKRMFFPRYVRMFSEGQAWNRNSVWLKWLLLVKVDINFSQIFPISKNSLLSILETCLSFTAKTFETQPCIMQKKGPLVLWPFVCCGLGDKVWSEHTIKSRDLLSYWFYLFAMTQRPEWSIQI